MRTRTITIVSTAGLLAGLTACSGGANPGTAAGAAPVPPPAVTQTVTVTATVTAPAPPAPPAPTVTVTVTATATLTAPPPATTAPPAETAPAEPADTIAGSGTFLVGTDIRPGTYRTAGPNSSSVGMCYWERSRAADGDLGSIIANENLMGQGVVTIKKTDVVFKTQGCQSWTKIG
ncbi:hypothetical protein ABTX81_17600 [Kitasatospora sp. NPDC097605]|uniref:hypothetical protein n=1 Tax=Kitasatospora sp. NPDC097605 TaxID=3157226 RepID=UPI003332B4F2